MYDTKKYRHYTACGPLTAPYCILMDSHAWSRPYVFWLPLFLSFWEQQTGKKAVAVCMPGARLLRDYIWMYEDCFRGQTPKDAILLVSMGNGITKLGKMPPSYYEKYAAVVHEFAKYGKVGLVFGGSKRTWAFNSQANELYDEHVARVCAACRLMITDVCDGAHELDGIEMADAAGHAKTSSVAVLIRACFLWSMRLLPVSSRM